MGKGLKPKKGGGFWRKFLISQGYIWVLATQRGKEGTFLKPIFSTKEGVLQKRAL